MNLKLLNEKHNLKVGNRVIVTKRNEGISYQGEIHKILNFPVNKNIQDLKNIFIDYFYISFPEETYYLLLSRGIEVIYNNELIIIGNIVLDKNKKIAKIYKQELFAREEEIDFKKIQGMLIWRIAYDIKLDA